MATTDTVRGWFHETVSNHSQRGTPGYEPRCNWGIAEIAPFPAEGGGTYREPVHPATTEAWDAYIKVMEHFGETIPSAGGVNSCRNIGSSDWPSLHAYLVAVDHPPNNRMRQKFIDAVLAIRTNNGKQVFLNGVVFNDRMHNQLNCSQADLATGIDWNTVKGARDDMPLTVEDADLVVDRFLARHIEVDLPNEERRLETVFRSLRYDAQRAHQYAKSNLGRLADLLDEVEDIDTAQVDEGALVAALVDAVEQEGIAQAVADEIDRRARERLN